MLRLRINDDQKYVIMKLKIVLLLEKLYMIPRY